MTEALPLSPSAIAEWIPFAKAAGFFLATFVLEDVAAVGAGLLLATGGTTVTSKNSIAPDSSHLWHEDIYD